MIPNPDGSLVSLQDTKHRFNRSKGIGFRRGAGWLRLLNGFLIAGGSPMNHPSTHAPRTVASSAWGLLAGLVGSICCLGPSTAVLLGLGSSSALFGLQFDRTLALGAGVALLLGGIARSLVRERSCALRSAARWRAPALMLAAFVLSYGLLGYLAPALAARQEDTAVVAPAAPVEAASLRRATLLIEKMDCPPCAAAIHNRLKQKPFVHHLVAEAYNQQVVIDYDSRQVDAQHLVQMFPMSYGITLVSDEPLP